MKASTMMMAVATLLLATACNSKSVSTEKDMNTLSFNQEQAALMTAIACNEWLEAVDDEWYGKLK